MEYFLLNGKKANVVPAPKKGDKQIQENCFPLPGKYFEKKYCILYIWIFYKNDLISHNQSGFKPSDSCINQLLLITHEIYKSFDSSLVCGVFLDISKAKWLQLDSNPEPLSS